MARDLRTLIWIVALGAAAALGPPLEANALALLADGRFVSSYSWGGPPSGLPPYESFETPTAPFAPFHVGRQDSEVTLATQGLPPNEFQLLSGNASGDAFGFVSGFDVSRSQSDFSITFRVDREARLDLAGTLDQVSSWGSLWVELFAGSASIYRRDVDYDDFFLTPIPTPFELSAVLAPGEYRIYAHALGTGPALGGGGSFDLSFSVFEPVPEPGTAALVALGAAALAARRRRELTSA